MIGISSMRPTPRGVSWASTATAVVAVGAAGVYYIIGGFQNLFLFVLAAVPALGFLALLRSGHSKDIPLQLYVEQFLCGCVISVGLAAALEALAQLKTLAVWRCESSPRFTIQCDVLFVIVITVSIGLTEEFCKFLPISRLKSRNQHLPPLANWWRVADTPFAYMLSGCAAAAGFACIENVGYAMKTGETSFAYGVNTAIFRAVLAFPFHIACTGYAASLVAYRQYVVPARLEEGERLSTWQSFWQCIKHTFPNLLARRRRVRSHRPNNGTNRNANEPYTLPLIVNESVVDPVTIQSELSNTTTGGVAGSLVGAPTGGSIPSAIYQPATPWTYLKILAIPATLHGLYDSGLFLAAQFMAESVRTARQARALQDQFQLTSRREAGGRLTDQGFSAILSPFLGLLTTVWEVVQWQGFWNGPSHGDSPKGISVLERQDALQQFERMARESQVYVTLGFLSSFVSLIADITMLALAVISWQRLIKFQRNAVPKIHLGEAF